MDLQIIPKKLSGTVTPPPSKSQAHRLLIAAALAEVCSIALLNLNAFSDGGGMAALFQWKGILLAVVGFFSFWDPVSQLFALSFLVGILLIFQGVSSILRACFAHRFWRL